MKNIALTGGGTGGHIYPCLAVAEELFGLIVDSSLLTGIITQDLTPNTYHLYYIGHSEKLEAELLTKNELTDSAGVPYSSYIKFLPIKTDPVINKLNPLKLVKWLTNFYTAFELSKKYLRENNITVVFGTGGYVAGPVFAAAIALKIPYIIHNLDSHMGLANRVFVRNAYALTLGICDLGIKPQNGRVIVTGNPVSQKFVTGLKKDLLVNGQRSTDEKLHLLITGGSQGAESINNAIGNLLPRLIKLNIDIVHVTGAKTYQDFVKKFLDGNPTKYSNYKVLAYTHEMPQLCAWADLTVCRSGAMTIAEMSASGVVPIFVPLPWAAHDHQTLNAKALVDAGAAMSLNQNDENFEEELFHTIKTFVNDESLLAELATALEAFGKNDAVKSISELILRIC